MTPEEIAAKEAADKAAAEKAAADAEAAKGDDGKGQEAAANAAADAEAAKGDDGKGQEAAANAAAAERRSNEWKAKYEALQKQVADASKADDVAAAVKAAEEKAKQDFDALQKQQDADREKDRKIFAIDLALTKAGCVDLVAAKAHIDLEKVVLADDRSIKDGFDVTKFTTEKAYLFPTTETESSGGAGKTPAQDDANDIASGVEDYYNNKKGK